METIGLIVFASLFVFSGVNHIRKHKDLSGYTTSVMGKCPFAKQLGYLGGWPTGVILIVAGVGTVFNQSSVFAYVLAGFLALATLLFHRKELLKLDPGALKGVALLGAALVIASHVS